MTRLSEQWIKNMTAQLEIEQARLKSICGLNYFDICAKSSDISPETLDKFRKSSKISVVKTTCGEGEIRSFSESICAIFDVAGFLSFSPKESDVSGIFHAQKQGADVIFMADDEKYIAINMHKNFVAENDFCTVNGFLTAMSHATGGLFGKNILVLGGGRLGKIAFSRLQSIGAFPFLYDINNKVCDDFPKSSCIKKDEILQFEYIFDATNTGNWLSASMLHKSAFISAPGVPLSLDKSAQKSHKDQLIHDILQIGTLAMLGECIK